MISAKKTKNDKFVAATQHDGLLHMKTKLSCCTENQCHKDSSILSYLGN